MLRFFLLSLLSMVLCVNMTGCTSANRQALTSGVCDTSNDVASSCGSESSQEEVEESSPGMGKFILFGIGGFFLLAIICTASALTQVGTGGA